jgi:hypothetical protein
VNERNMPTESPNLFLVYDASIVDAVVDDDEKSVFVPYVFAAAVDAVVVVMTKTAAADYLYGLTWHACWVL